MKDCCPPGELAFSPLSIYSGFFFLFCLLTLKIIWNSRQLVAQGGFTLNLFSFNLMGLVSKADYCGAGDVQRPVRV